MCMPIGNSFRFTAIVKYQSYKTNLMNHEELINTLNECANYCNHCADACLEEDHIQMMVTCIRYDHMCAEVCSSLAKLLSINVPSQKLTALVEYCKNLCESCAEECSSHEAQHCQNCAAACKRCVDVCSKFLYNH